MVLLFCMAIYSPASAEKKPWERIIMGRIIGIDKKYDILTVEVKKEKGILIFKKTDIVRMSIRILTSPNQTAILINGMRGTMKDIKIGDIVNIEYNVTPMDNTAQKINVTR